MQLLDGKLTAEDIRAEIKEEVEALGRRYKRPPGLAVILVGDDPASRIYVRNKERACQQAGIVSQVIRLDASAAQQEVEQVIHDCNRRSDLDGMLLQLPLPPGLDSQACLSLIAPEKDVDGFHPVNMGRLALGLPGFSPCTPAGIIALLKRYDIPMSGKKAVVVGRSNIVGKPLALLLLKENATVCVCHSRTRDLAAETRTAELLFAAVGRPRMITADMVMPGAVVVDVGMNRTEQGLAGDCDFAGLADKVSAMTPVPGGVGPMTIAQLLLNTVQAYKRHVVSTKLEVRSSKGEQ